MTDHQAGAARVVTRMKLQIARIVRAAKPRAAGLTVYHELSPDGYSATSKTFIGLVYAQFGLKNIADAADRDGFGYPQLSSEYIVKESPDVIVLADSVCCAQTPGKVETLGRTVEGCALIYYAAGEAHGMRNVGEQPARYLVFEFHAPRQMLRNRFAFRVPTAERIAGSVSPTTIPTSVIPASRIASRP